ncbi:biorientation of chromosomes in cell division protein 1-like 1 [Trichogramma pretiosum]|uniref:biorientation of chromosomes in cell division protein 1-like 1 n=1 Tax=Trichogramma pretiosum TaxID=7493 RepID=UPI0006C9563F|nr:biorientation of chromosomes in cell division protein 1-like 1 [Trichogramma pretiosum]
MEMDINNSMIPGDQRLIDHIVGEVKSQGIFDQFRKECLADVDTKPAYQNLRTRVESSVTSFLSKQTWRADLNKNQLRETLRKHIRDAPYLDVGIERIVDQVVNPKIYSNFMPHIEDVVYKYMGIERPKPQKNGSCDLTDLLPKDLDPISESDSEKESEKNLVMDIKKEDDDDMEIKETITEEMEKPSSNVSEEKPILSSSIVPEVKEETITLENQESMEVEESVSEKVELNTSIKSDDANKTEEDEEESPMFEPIEAIHAAESNMSNDSPMSGISELTSPTSRSPDYLVNTARDNFDGSNQDSQFSKVSSNSHLSIVTDIGSSNQASNSLSESKDDIKSSKDNFKAVRENDSTKDSFEFEVAKKNMSSNLSKENSQDATDFKNSKDKYDSRTKSSKDKYGSHSSRDKDKDSKKQYSSKYSKHSRSKSRDQNESEKSESQDSVKYKDSKTKDSESSKDVKDLKDLYKEKIRELREKKELTEKEKFGRSSKDSKETKDKKENSNKDDSKKSSSKSSSDRRHSSQSDSRDKYSNTKYEEKKSVTSKNDSKSSSSRRDSKYESRSSDRSRDKKRTTEKKSKDDHASHKRNSHEHRSIDREGSNDFHSKNSDKSSHESNLSKVGQTSKGSSRSSHLSGESSNNVIDLPAKFKNSHQEHQLKRVDPGSSEISLPLKKRPLPNSDSTPCTSAPKKPKIDDTKVVKKKNDIFKSDMDVECVPDDERVQIVEYEDEDYDGPYPEPNPILSIEETKKIILDTEQFTQSAQTKLSEMEQSIRDSLREMMADHVTSKSPINESTEDSISNSTLVDDPKIVTDSESLLETLTDDSVIPSESLLDTTQSSGNLLLTENIEENIEHIQMDVDEAERSIKEDKKKLEASFSNNETDIKNDENISEAFDVGENLVDTNTEENKNDNSQEYKHCNNLSEVKSIEAPQELEVIKDNVLLLNHEESSNITTDTDKIEETEVQDSKSSSENSKVEVNDSIEKIDESVDSNDVFNEKDSESMDSTGDNIDEGKLIIDEDSEKENDQEIKEQELRNSESRDQFLIDTGAQKSPASDCSNNVADEVTDMNNETIQKNIVFVQKPIETIDEKIDLSEDNILIQSSKRLESIIKYESEDSNSAVSSIDTDLNKKDSESTSIDTSNNEDMDQESIKPSLKRRAVSPIEEDCYYLENDTTHYQNFLCFLRNFEANQCSSPDPPVELRSSEVLDSQSEAISPGRESDTPSPAFKFSTDSTSEISSSNSTSAEAVLENPLAESEIMCKKKKKAGRAKKIHNSPSTSGQQQVHQPMQPQPGTSSMEDFLMPLSPVSDASVTSDLGLTREEKGRNRSRQRYSSDDLYKPRPLITSSTRRQRRFQPA